MTHADREFDRFIRVCRRRRDGSLYDPRWKAEAEMVNGYRPDTPEDRTGVPVGWTREGWTNHTENIAEVRRQCGLPPILP